MKSIISFWKKDIINKLIVIVLLALIGIVAASTWLIINMPERSLLSGFLAQVLPDTPTPTFDISIYLTPSNLEYVTQPVMETPAPAYTQTSIPTLEIITPTSTPSLVPIQATLAPSTSVSMAGGMECIPNVATQTGKVVEVIDGNTVRVLLEDGLVYIVRYNGVALPTDRYAAEKLRQKNAEWVFGRVVTLISDAVNRDDSGRLLRYVLAENNFVNVEMIRQGMANFLDVPSGLACAQTLKLAEQDAANAKVGMWSVTSTPVSP